MYKNLMAICKVLGVDADDLSRETGVDRRMIQGEQNIMVNEALQIQEAIVNRLTLEWLFKI